LSKRNEYIDWLKGFAIFLVVLGHCWLVDKNTFWLIYTFHMPLFFCISGYLFSKKKRFKEFIMSKIKTIIIPYIIFCLISYILTYLFVKHISIKTGLIALVLNGKYLVKINNWALWYLPLFFIASILFYLILKIRNKKVYYTIILICGILTVPLYKCLSGIVVKDYIPFSLQVIPAALFFLGVGNITREKMSNIKIRKLPNKAIVIISFILFVLGIILSIGSKNQIIQISSYKYIIASLLIIQFIILITKDNNNKIIKYMGKNSLIILGLHRIILKIAQEYHIGKFLKNLGIKGTIASLLISIVCIAIICFINEVYKFVYSKTESIIKKRIKKRLKNKILYDIL